MKIVVNDEKLYDELVLILKLYYTEDEIASRDITFDINQDVKDNVINTMIKVTGEYNYIDFRSDKILNSRFPMKYHKRYSKLALYFALKQFNPTKFLPWGSLTGIRPTKLYYELLNDNDNSHFATINQFVNEFDVSLDKAEMCSKIIQNQNIVRDDKYVDFYVNIPFCTTKCYYCSFISSPLSQCKQYVEPYIDALIKEIEAAKAMIKDRGLEVKTMYMGGGTPTALTAEQLDRVLDTLDYNVSEFTVEAGRPDTITKEKLDVLKKHGVTRISINPQSFSNKTLKAIGRSHTAEDIIEAYRLAIPYDFSVNMDLIAGLNKESFATFKKSVDMTIDCAPDNITVHTLSIKKASSLKENGGDISTEKNTEKMITYSISALQKAGYKPYYLYKQKNMIGNLENIGYFRDTPCIFNIDTMEEVCSIVACGANAISKRYYVKDNKIERQANLKNLQEYITRIDEMIEKKNNLFK